MDYYERLQHQAEHLRTLEPTLALNVAYECAERQLRDVGITRSTHPTPQTLSAEGAAKRRAYSDLAAQAKWERAGDPSLTEAEAITAAAANLRASNREYAAVMGRQSR